MSTAIHAMTPTMLFICSTSISDLDLPRSLLRPGWPWGLVLGPLSHSPEARLSGSDRSSLVDIQLTHESSIFELKVGAASQPHLASRLDSRVRGSLGVALLLAYCVHIVDLLFPAPIITISQPTTSWVISKRARRSLCRSAPNATPSRPAASTRWAPTSTACTADRRARLRAIATPTPTSPKV